MKSYPDFSLNAQIEHRNFDISFLGFKIFNHIKIKANRTIYQENFWARNTQTGKFREGRYWDTIAKKSFFEVRS